MTAVVTLIRHLAVDPAMSGRCYGRRSDPSLAPDATAHLPTVEQSVDERVTSPARRARDTAAALHPGPWRLATEWAERDFGDWEGRRWEDCWAGVPHAAVADAAAYLDFDPPGAEPYNAVAERVAAGLEALQIGSSVVVTHLGTIRAVLHRCCDWSPDQVFAQTIRPGGVVVLGHDGQRWSVTNIAPGATP